MISEPKLSKFEDKKQVLHFKKVIVKYTYIYIYNRHIIQRYYRYYSKKT